LTSRKFVIEDISCEIVALREEMLTDRRATISNSAKSCVLRVIGNAWAVLHLFPHFGTQFAHHCYS
jgi:hypothetical protein